MKNFSKFIVAVAAVAVVGSTADAQMVTYSTSGLFSGGAGCTTNVCTVGGGTITFNGINPAANPIAPTNISFGDFITSFAFAGGAGNFAGKSFTLTITQTAPTGGAQAVAGSIMGVFTSASSSSLSWTPVPTAFSIGTVQYSLQSGTYLIVPPETNGGLTSIQGSITTVPEPSTYALMAAGLAAMGLVARRRRQTNA